MFLFFSIFTSSLIGIAISFFLMHVRNTGKGRKHTTCPPYYDCHLVVASKYANFLGVPIEFLGILYYSLILCAYIAIALFPFIHHSSIVFLLLVITTIAFCFSLYLTLIQLVSLRKICAWCIASGLLCTIIFISALGLTGGGLIPLLIQFKSIITIVHLLGFALGVGGATVTDMFFFRFLRDYHISKWEANIMHMVSQLIWIGLAILVISGLGLYLQDAEVLNMSSKFITKVIIVGVILLNGILLNLYISPKMIMINFGKKHKHHPGELHQLRRAAFASGAVSLVSWYSAFILGSLRSIPLQVSQALFIYLILLVGAVGGSQLVERFFDAKARLKQE